MKKIIFIIIILILSNVIKANNFYIPKDSTKQRKTHYGLSVSFNRCYSFINHYNKSNTLVNNYVDSVKSVLLPDNGFCFGFILNRKIANKYCIETGLSWKKDKIKTIILYRDDPYYNNGKIPCYYTYDYYYASLPIVLVYNYFLWKKIALNAELGISSDFKINAFQTLIWKKSGYANTSEFLENTILFGGLGNLRITFGDKLSQFSVFANFNYSLNGLKYSTFIENNKYTEHLFYYGFGVGLTF